MATGKRNVRGKNFAERMAAELKRGGQGPLILIEYAKPEMLTETDSSGQSAIMLACKAGRMDVVQVLLASGVDPKQIAIDGSSLLLHAALGKNFELCKHLYELGVSPSKANGVNFTPIAAAVQAGSIELVRWFLSMEPKVALDVGQWATNPVMIATRSKNAEILRLLLAAGASTRIDNSEMSAAVYSQSIEVTKVFLEYQPQLFPTLISQFVTFNAKELLETYLADEAQVRACKANRGASEQAVVMALNTQKFELVELLLEKLPFLQLEGQLGVNMLNAATRNAETLRWLLTKDLRIEESKRTQSGFFSPLAARGEWELVRLLWEKGFRWGNEPWFQNQLKQMPEELRKALTD